MQKSKRVYIQHQLTAIYAFMKYTKSHYRDIIELIDCLFADGFYRAKP